MAHRKKRYVVNFPGHLADCEFNYRRLCRLMPDWPIIDADQQDQSTDDDIPLLNEWNYIISNNGGQRVVDEMALSIQVTEKAKYTTTVHIVVYSRLQNQASWVKYHKAGAKSLPLKPNSEFSLVDHSLGTKIPISGFKAYSLDVRLYHDADVAEVIAWQGQRRFKVRHEYPNRNMYQRDEKAQLNKFLGELLEFCLVQGRVMQDIVSV